MSIHTSLKMSGALAGVRNVWTRVERLSALKKVGRWEEGDAVTGLPKVRTVYKSKPKKQAETEAATEASEDGAVPAEVAADEKSGS
jgi:small basic protein (TIGR04137 family)